MTRRRIAVLVAGVVLFGGVVAVLRTAGVDTPATPTSTSVPPPTSLAPFAAEGVLVPRPGEAPHTLDVLTLRPGPRRIQASWTGTAPGYEVSWGRDGRLDHTALVARTTAQIDGLDDGVEYTVRVREVDAFGQRSEPMQDKATPHTQDVGSLVFVDRFDQPDAPDPRRWRFTSRPNCARATPGRGDDGARLVISGSCAAAPAALRSRTPFVLRDADDLGRFVVETDGPGPDGELFVDLVPGPFSVLVGESLPPNALRLRVASGGGTSSVSVLTPAGTPTTRVRPVPTLEPGLTHRWELVLRRDGTTVLLDGTPVATSPAVPAWREATALLSVAGPTGQRVNVSLIGFDGVTAQAPELVPPPPIRVKVAAEAPPPGDLKPIPGLTGGQLRLSILHSDPAPTPPPFEAVIGGVRVPLRPAVADTPWAADTAYAVIADVPAEALRWDGAALHVTVLSAQRLQATNVDLEPTGTPGTPPDRGDVTPLGGDKTLARATGTVLDASGNPLPENTPVHRGRLVFDLVLDGVASQRGAGIAGLAGFTVRLDGDRVASVPTALGGPAVAGRYRLAVDTQGLAEGPHMIEVKLFGTSSDTVPTSAFVPFFVGR
ncbi:hypothetical protein GCM10022243_64720 [Saccharothrix violaceirubra]|uniref:Fibronectin type-III domain-containing protein n=1 Tax=Saccharothrix violaceirubra TaxID=413306 RepID=A0A7W7TAH3_9PSEU|nr:hypothetical protein [Saccharothrix violaceirubra]MBB4969042.1 hypothetical protein [Saccharothrix violaceirubra]